MTTKLIIYPHRSDIENVFFFSESYFSNSRKNCVSGFKANDEHRGCKTLHRLLEKLGIVGIPAGLMNFAIVLNS